MMVDIHSIKSRKVQYSERQAFFPMDFNFLSKTQTRQFQCSYCGAFIPEKQLSRDHVYPKSKGGSVTTASCMDCNEAKKDMLPIEWAIYASTLDLAVSPVLFKGVGQREKSLRSTPKTSEKKDFSDSTNPP